MPEPFRYCLNTSTLRGYHLTLAELVEVAGDAGYRGIEPWTDEIARHRDEGGSLPDLAARIRDRGLVVESAIGFAEWVVDEPERRAKGLEQMRRDMGLVAAIGGTRIAAPPAGATDDAGLSLVAAAERYAAVLRLGEEAGVAPQVEVWGFSRALSRLGDALYVAVESGHPRACVLPDVYHLYKGGSPFSGLRLLSPSAIGVFHVNDYRADPPREAIRDSDRVLPGDGIAPLSTVVQALAAIGYRGALSLELFNPAYWQGDPRAVARKGLAAVRACVRRALV
ncbi:MAG: sugar phosphate isomerase/epimerase [Chthonomonadales bacterium]|nr:sugar phosphate isomerase/epimerase [Chthonomonadales bacterium]